MQKSVISPPNKRSSLAGKRIVQRRKNWQSEKSAETIPVRVTTNVHALPHTLHALWPLTCTYRYLSSQGLQADDHWVEVLPLPKVNSLEGLLSGDAHRAGAVQEGVDVLHALERHLWLVDFLHWSGLDFVCKPKESVYHFSCRKRLYNMGLVLFMKEENWAKVVNVKG